MKANWKDDYYRMTGTRFAFTPSHILTLLISHQIRYVKLWRRSNARPSVLNRLRLIRCGKKYGIEISPNAKIGAGLYLGHAYNITVSGDAVLGDNVNLHKGCTIGRENRGKRTGAPKLGNRVFVGINATIVGDITVGNDVLIAPNSYVNFDVPDHSVVIGNPATVHSKESATQGYIAFTVQ